MITSVALWRGRDIRAALSLTGEGWERLHPDVRQRALHVLDDAHRAGLSVGVFEGYRTAERQAQYMQQGTSWVGSADSSYHRWGLAVDFVFLDAVGRWTWERPRADWDRLGAIIERHGFAWGGRFSTFDGPHAELRLFTVAQLKAAHGAPEQVQWT